MPFMDTQIIPRRIAAKKRRALDISNTVVIDGISYGFQRVLILDDAVSIIVPDSFNEMTAEAAKLKYPSEYRPQYILTSDDGLLNMAFSLLDYPLANSQIDEKVGELRTGIKRINPAFVFLTEKVETLHDRRIGCFDYNSYAFDGDAYHLMFVTNIDNNMLLGTFNCPIEQCQEWKTLVAQMALSIEDRTAIMPLAPDTKNLE